jgi:hypothetical protein
MGKKLLETKTYLFDVRKGESEPSKYSQQELRVCNKLFGEPKDSVLWLTKHLSIHYENLGRPRDCAGIYKELHTEDLNLVPFDWLYSLFQQGVPKVVILNTMRQLVLTDWKYAKLDFEQWSITMHFPNIKDIRVVYMLLTAFVTKGKMSSQLTPSYVKMCHPDFLRKGEYDNRELLELLRDTTAGKYEITSMNVLRELHDRQAMDKAAALLNNPQRFTYESELLDILDGTQWHWAMGPGEMAHRGFVHHNCVASYADKVKQGSCLIAMTEDCTAEVRATVSHGIITKYDIVQCKGKFNKDNDIRRKELETILDKGLLNCGQGILDVGITTVKKTEQVA